MLDEASSVLHATPTLRGHGESEPRSVGISQDAHGMTLLLQRTRTQSHNSTKASLKAADQGLLVSQ